MSVRCKLTGLSRLIAPSLSLPFCIEVRGSVLLSSGSSRPTSINSICPDIFSPLLIYHNEHARHAYRPVPQLKKSDENVENGFLKACRSQICNRTTTSLAQVLCSCQPVFFSFSSSSSVESWLLLSGIHSTLSSRYQWGTARLWRACGSVDRRKHPPYFLQDLIHGNFSARCINASPDWSVVLTEFFIGPNLLCRGGSKFLLLSSVSGR
jgi:hypothetical protein